MSYTQTITLGALSTTSIVYSPWLGSIVGILRDAGLGWITTHLLIRDVDVDIKKGTTIITFGVFGQKPGESAFSVTITLVCNDD